MNECKNGSMIDDFTQIIFVNLQNTPGVGLTDLNFTNKGIKAKGIDEFIKFS